MGVKHKMPLSYRGNMWVRQVSYLIVTGILFLFSVTSLVKFDACHILVLILHDWLWFTCQFLAAQFQYYIVSFDKVSVLVGNRIQPIIVCYGQDTWLVNTNNIAKLDV